MTTFRTLQYLTSPELASLYWPGVVTGLAIAVLCAALSVIVVLKRLAFIGQGISHAAFGGVGVAAALGFAAGMGGSATGGAGAGYWLIVLAFCLAAGLGIGWLSGGRAGEQARTQADTAIGIVLVASMALGAALLQYAFRHGRGAGVAWESLLFGSIMNVSWCDAAVAWGVTATVLGALWWWRRPMMFWAFDESSSSAFGVPVGRMRFVLLLMLAVATVTAMKLAGVVLATAMLVLPGAAALQMSHRLRAVMVLAFVIAVAGMAGGLVVSFETDQPSGACVVLVLSAVFAAAWGRRSLAGARGRPAPTVN